MEKHLWEVEHDYYCNLGNYLGNGYCTKYDSFDDFLSDWKDADMDYNLLFRWDWKVEDPNDVEEGEQPRDYDILEVFWMLQRKGHFICSEVKIQKEDEENVKEFLKPRWDYLKGLWQPLE